MLFNGSFIFPPRPATGSVVPDGALFRQYEQSGFWIAQAKLNGSNTVAWIKKSQIKLWNRHGQKSSYEIPKSLASFLVEHFDDCVVNFELLHKRTRHIKDTIYLYDILVHEGEWLVSRTYWDRFDLLKSLLPPAVPLMRLPVDSVAPSVWLARCIPGPWGKLYGRYGQIPEFEGLILKKLTGRLEPGMREKNNGLWSLRARKKVGKN